jgi:hypothetical protein
MKTFLKSFLFVAAVAAGASSLMAGTTGENGVSPKRLASLNFAARAAEAVPPLTKQEVKDLIKTAKTPEDHAKLARYYWFEADKLKSEANDHEEMGAEYAQNPSNHPIPKWPKFGQHCRDLSGYYAEAAKEAEKMATMHQAMAKAAEGVKITLIRGDRMSAYEL